MRWCGVGGIGESYEVVWCWGHRGVRDHEVVWCWGHRGVVLLNGL